MINDMSRRALLRGSLAAAGLGVLGIPEWVVPAMGQGERLVPFVDMPQGFNTTPTEITRVLDLRKIDGLLTPRDQFFTTQHLGHPEIDISTFRLRVTGLVERPQELSVDQLRGLGAVDLVAGFECSGNSPRRVQGLASNGSWTGVPLRAVLNAAGVKPGGREVVFFGSDHGEEEVEFRDQQFKVDQQFGRSVSREEALGPDPFLAWAMNGEPLTRHQGFPLRLVMPGWYGVANVKWLAQVHVQTEQYLGKYQARWYRTLRGETINGEVKWKETAITRMRVKSVIARVTRDGDQADQCKVLGFVLNDGTPLRSVEVRIDDGPWQPATLDASSQKYSWKLFTFDWKGAKRGPHTLVSRATDAAGNVQPEPADLESKKTFLEDNGQYPRKVMIA
jgi:DMSO/TMAO reductase YedYZ molybdopterin-dependent catalytic subunit